MLIPVWTLPLRHISSSLGVARPFTNGVEWGWKKCTEPMVGGARSITLYDACTPSSAPHPHHVFTRSLLEVVEISGWSEFFKDIFTLVDGAERKYGIANHNYSDYVMER